MSCMEKIKVSSKSFSLHPALREELLKEFPNAKFNETLIDFSSESFADFVHDAAGIIVGLEPVVSSVLIKCPGLQIVSKFGVGLDNIDRKATNKYNVKIGWTGGINRRSVSEMALCFMLGLSRNISFSARKLITDNDWSKNGGSNLSNKIIGIIGIGFIGRDLVNLLKPFGCKILVNDILDQSDYYKANGLNECSKDNIYAEADIVSLHLPLNETTRGMFSSTVFEKMKKSSFFINCARGGLVVQEDLKSALINCEIAGAAIDVFEAEPSDDLEFIQLPNLIATPHTGGSSSEAILSMGRSAIKHLVNHFSAKLA